MPLYEMMKSHLEDEVSTSGELKDFVTSLSDEMQEKLAGEIEDKKAKLSDETALTDATGAEIVDEILSRDGLKELVVDGLGLEQEVADEKVTELVGVRWQVLGDSVQTALETVNGLDLEDDLEDDTFEIESLQNHVQDADNKTEILGSVFAAYDAVEDEYKCPLVRVEEGVFVANDEAAETLQTLVEDADAHTKTIVDNLFAEEEEIVEDEEEETPLPAVFEGLDVVDEVYNEEAARERLMKWARDNREDRESLDAAFLTVKEEFTDTGASTTYLIPVGDIKDEALVLNKHAVRSAAKRVSEADLEEDVKDEVNELITQTTAALGLQTDSQKEVPADLIETAERLGVEDAEELGYETLLAAIRDKSGSFSTGQTTVKDNVPNARSILARLR